jgi:hypothetical protein
VAVTAATGVGTRTATLTGTINPEGAVTTYHWLYIDALGRYGGSLTANETLPAVYSPQPVATPITGLTPGVTYTVTLVASNSAGDASAVMNPALTTASHPILTIGVSATSIAIGRAFQVFVRRAGDYDPYAAVDIYIAKAPYRHWVNVGQAASQVRGSLAAYPCPAHYQYVLGCAWLDRNFKIRAETGASQSPARLVYVHPFYAFTTARETDISPYLDLTYSATVHTTHGAYPRQAVYFYASRARNGPFTRVAIRPLRARPSYYSEQLIATARIHEPASVYTIACTRHQLFRDMGRRFVLRQCGAPRVP